MRQLAVVVDDVAERETVEPPIVGFVGLWNDTTTRSSGSTSVSPITLTVTVLAVSPGANVTVPLAGT